MPNTRSLPLNDACQHDGAWFSAHRTYRYTLWRKCDDYLATPGYVMFIGLNPSVADEECNDPTVRRCWGFTRSWGYAHMCMTNLFGLRATDPSVMLAHVEPVGEDNDRALAEVASGASLIVAAWGNHGQHLGRSRIVMDALRDREIYALRLNRSGEPAHPLYLPGALAPMRWTPSYP